MILIAKTSDVYLYVYNAFGALGYLDTVIC